MNRPGTRSGRDVVCGPSNASHSHGAPEFLPGGRAVVFHVRFSGGIQVQKATQLAVFDLQTGVRRMLLEGNNPRYAPATRELVFARGDTLWRASFDIERLEITGEPVPIVNRIGSTPGGFAMFAVSAAGSLAYIPGGVTGGVEPRTLVLMDRQGREERLPGLDPNPYGSVRVSPDGTPLAFHITAGGNVWTYDLARGARAVVTTDAANNRTPVWSADGQHIVFSSDRDQPGRHGLYRRRADGTGPIERVLGAEVGPQLYAHGWSTDGRLLFVRTGDRRPDIMVHSLEAGKTELLIETPSMEDHPAVSPNGRWIAYHSDVSGRTEIYVDRSPQLVYRQPVSVDGGQVPHWSPTGHALYYLSADGRRLMAVAIEAGSTFKAGKPTVLFEGTVPPPEGPSHPYDVMPDGKRFVVIKNAAQSLGQSDPVELVVVHNWASEQK